MVFYQLFVFSPNACPSKTTENVSYFILKALLVLEIFKFLLFFSLLSTLSRFKRTNGSRIIYNVMNYLHKFADVFFGITQKLFYNTFGQIIYN